jgi:hypothetical protein
LGEQPLFSCQHFIFFLIFFANLLDLKSETQRRLSTLKNRKQLRRKQEPGLSVRDVIKTVYQRLQRQLKTFSLRLPQPVYSVIADDSDYPGDTSRRGYMVYKWVAIAQIGFQTWLLARGERSGRYPDRPFDSDIIAVPLDDLKGTRRAQRIKIAQEVIRHCWCFDYSLIIGKESGAITIREDHPLSSKFKKIPWQDYIAQEVKTVPGVITVVGFSIQKVVGQQRRYKPGIVKILTDMCVGYLKAQSQTSGTGTGGLELA